MLRLLFIGLSLGFLTASAHAVECTPKLIETIPLEFADLLPVVVVKINGQRVLMGVDTGAQTTLLTPEAAERLQLRSDPNHSAMLYGAGESKRVPKVIVDTLELGNLKSANLHVSTVALPFPRLKNGQVVSGLIGIDTLSPYEIDYFPLAKRLWLYSANNCARIKPPWPGSYDAIPITITATHRIALPVELDGHRLSAIFDSGANGFRLSRSSASRAGLTEAALARDPVSNMSGAGTGELKVPLHQFKSVKVGTETFTDPSIEVAVLHGDECDLLLGEDFMHSRRFWISSATQTLYVQRVRMRTPAK